MRSTKVKASLGDLKTTIPGIFIIMAVFMGFWTGKITTEHATIIIGIATATGLLATKG